MVKEQKLPKHLTVERLPTGTIRLHPVDTIKPVASKEAVIYARINPRQPQADLNDQIRRCRDFCSANGWIVKQVIREKAPSLGSKKARLIAHIPLHGSCLVVARASVISRYDADLIELLFKNLGCPLAIIDRSPEVQGEGGALEDLSDAISLTCNLHYGQKRGALLVEAMNKVISQRQ